MRTLCSGKIKNKVKKKTKVLEMNTKLFISVTRTVAKLNDYTIILPGEDTNNNRDSCSSGER